MSSTRRRVVAEAVLKAAPRRQHFDDEPRAAAGRGRGAASPGRRWSFRRAGALAAADALRYSAVQLFNERAMAADDGFALADADVPAVLRDLPPARRHAAGARTGGGARRRFWRSRDLRGASRRSFPASDQRPAHRSAPASDACRCARLELSAAPGRRADGPASSRAYFAGDFPMEAACARRRRSGPGSEMVDHVANLVGKSLVAADPRGEVAQYRLLDTTRLYASEKLKSSGELQQIARRHAEYYRAMFRTCRGRAQWRPQAEWLAIYGRHLDNVRAGLDWAFSPEGDPPIGVALTVAVVPLWVQLSLLGECRERVERALASLDGDAGGNRAAAHAAFRGARLVADVRRRPRPRGRRRLGDDAGARGKARRHGLPADAPSGACASTNSTMASFVLRSSSPGASPIWRHAPAMRSI